MANITIGQYYPAKSHIHSLDPRVKLGAVFVYIVMLFTVKGFPGYAVTALFLVTVIYASHVPPHYIFRGLKSILMILLITVGLNIFFHRGETVLVRFFSIQITTEGIVAAAEMGLRLVLLLLGSSMLTLTTSPIQLTDAMEFFMRPLRKIGVPAHEIAMMMTITLRFIPTLLEELDKIMKAQKARGADFDTGGLIKKAKSMIPLLVPLFISAFRRADELAMAMEARCYRGDVHRTKMKALVLRPWDYKAMGCVCVFVVMVLMSWLVS